MARIEPLTPSNLCSGAKSLVSDALKKVVRIFPGIKAEVAYTGEVD